MFPPIYQLLKGAAPVTAILGANPKVYSHGVAPLDAVPPYVLWLVNGSEPQNGISDAPNIDRVSVQLDCYHTEAVGVANLATAVRNALEPHATFMGIPIDEREPETKLYRIALQFDYWLAR